MSKIHWEKTVLLLFKLVKAFDICFSYEIPLPDLQALWLFKKVWGRDGQEGAGECHSAICMVSFSLDTVWMVLLFPY